MGERKMLCLREPNFKTKRRLLPPSDELLIVNGDVNEAAINFVRRLTGAKRNQREE